MSKHESEILELEDRDPNVLNERLQLSWEDIIGEPHSEFTRSPECAWAFSKQCFKMSRHGCYILLSILFAPIAACVVGISFACLSFKHIWCITPCLRMWKISCNSTRDFIKPCAQAIIIPITEACGYFWSQFKVKQQRLPDGEEKQEEAILI